MKIFEKKPKEVPKMPEKVEVQETNIAVKQSEKERKAQELMDQAKKLMEEDKLDNVPELEGISIQELSLQLTEHEFKAYVIGKLEEISNKLK